VCTALRGEAGWRPAGSPGVTPGILGELTPFLLRNGNTMATTATVMSMPTATRTLILGTSLDRLRSSIP
jgi:hypothetical protein